jgi:hypothetical protein
VEQAVVVGWVGGGMGQVEELLVNLFDGFSGEMWIEFVQGYPQSLREDHLAEILPFGIGFTWGNFLAVQNLIAEIGKQLV